MSVGDHADQNGIVVDTPAFDLLLRILERDELVDIQALITQPSG